EDRLDELPCGRTSGMQPFEILERIVQPVDMIDANAVENARVEPLEHPRVKIAEDLFALGPHADQRVDIEEPPITELAARDLPIREPAMLPVDDRVEHIG